MTFGFIALYICFKGGYSLNVFCNWWSNYLESLVVLVHTFLIKIVCLVLLFFPPHLTAGLFHKQITGEIRFIYNWHIYFTQIMEECTYNIIIKLQRYNIDYYWRKNISTFRKDLNLLLSGSGHLFNMITITDGNVFIFFFFIDPNKNISDKRHYL